MHRPRPLILILLAVGVVLALGLRLLVGDRGVSWPEDPTIVEIRATRAIIAFIVGMALSISGVLLQSTLRNPLASPYILGLSAGAGLAVVLWHWLASWLTIGSGLALLLEASPIGAAVIGAFAALAVVYFLSQRRGAIDPTTLILVGVVVTMICGALTVFFQQMLTERGISAVARWMMGSINEGTSRTVLAIVLLATIAGSVASILLARPLDGAMLSEDEARSIGVPIARVRMLSFLIAGVMTASTVVVAGPIGFVGLICPHLARLLVGPAHRALIPAAALIGATLLVLADVLIALVRLPSGRIPIGVLTALIGGPAFIIILLRRRDQLA